MNSWYCLVNWSEERAKNTVSLMPADLAQLLSPEELTDVVEYLGTLKKAN